VQRIGRQGNCKACNREYRQTNKEAIAGQQRVYRQTNKVAIAEYMRVYDNTGTCVDCGGSCYRSADRCNPCMGRARIGVGNPRWQGDNISYGAAHDRVYAAHGPASDHQCVDCNGEAREWSYKHGDPNELTQLVEGYMLAYSCDPSYYEPRCVPCHRSYDLQEAHPQLV